MDYQSMYPQQQPPAQPQGQDLMQALLKSMMQPQQRPDPSAYGSEQADVDAILNQVANLDRRDLRSKGILGYFGRKSRGKKRDELMGQYKSELAQALAEKNRFMDAQSRYDQSNQMRDKVFGKLLDQKFKDPSDWDRYMSDPKAFADFKAAGRGPGVTVNTGGGAPKGFQWGKDGSLEPIKGGEEWYKREQDRLKAEAAGKAGDRKATSRIAGIRRAGGTVVQDLGRAREMIPKMIQGDGVIGANARLAASKIPGTSEYYMNEFIDSAKSNIGLDKLQQMRESNETGGALGQVPIAQQLRLEKVLGSIDPGMKIQMMTDNINRIQNIYFDIMFGSPEERKLAVEQGLLSQEESDEVDTYYSELSFDEFGKRRDGEQDAPEQADDKFMKEINGKRYVKINGKWFEQ